MLALYQSCLKHPLLLLCFSLAIAVGGIAGIANFRFDASADTLVVQGYPRLRQYTEMSALFGGDDFVVLTYTSDDMFTHGGLSELAELQAKMGRIDGIRSTYSILDAPLVEVHLDVLVPI